MKIVVLLVDLLLFIYNIDDKLFAERPREAQYGRCVWQPWLNVGTFKLNIDACVHVGKRPQFFWPSEVYFYFSLPVGFSLSGDSKRSLNLNLGLWFKILICDANTVLNVALSTSQALENQRDILLCPFGWPQDIVEFSTLDGNRHYRPHFRLGLLPETVLLLRVVD